MRVVSAILSLCTLLAIQEWLHHLQVPRDVWTVILDCSEAIGVIGKCIGEIPGL